MGGPGAPAARLATVLFALLLAASLVTAAIIVRAKTPDLMLEVTGLPHALHDPATGVRLKHGFTPDGDGRRDFARFTLFIRADEPHARIELIDRTSKVVRTLARDVHLRKDRKVRFRWDGRTNEGFPAPAGAYRLQAVLPSLDRVAVDPRRIVIVRR